MGLSVGLSLISTVGNVNGLAVGLPEVLASELKEEGEFDDAMLGANDEGPLVAIPGSIGEELGRDDGNESVASSG